MRLKTEKELKRTDDQVMAAAEKIVRIQVEWRREKSINAFLNRWRLTDEQVKIFLETVYAGEEL